MPQLLANITATKAAASTVVVASTNHASQVRLLATLDDEYVLARPSRRDRDALSLVSEQRSANFCSFCRRRALASSASCCMSVWFVNRETSGSGRSLSLRFDGRKLGSSNPWLVTGLRSGGSIRAVSGGKDLLR